MQWRVDSVPPHLQGPPFWADRVTPVLGGALGLVSQVYARRSRGMQAQNRHRGSQGPQSRMAAYFVTRVCVRESDRAGGGQGKQGTVSGVPGRSCSQNGLVLQWEMRMGWKVSHDLPDTSVCWGALPLVPFLFPTLRYRLMHKLQSQTVRVLGSEMYQTYTFQSASELFCTFAASSLEWV